eukprot:TRINITY_DN5290_c0_g1_i1.p2 TRINITY_DN5290_c0_g1~~TRINITY_DN5290_c0_g1_i1.p2  ORF type:complete len:234 (-),score=32.60 TRINITY_DN5290_c0_g1_i1:541-1242(-)
MGRRRRGPTCAHPGKRTGTEKKVGKEIEQHAVAEFTATPTSSLPVPNPVLSPPGMGLEATSPIGSWNDSVTRKTLANLILTMNSSFQDYDFRSVRPEQFTLYPSLDIIMHSINQNLDEAYRYYETAHPAINLRQELWGEIDKVVDLQDSKVYSFLSDGESDPFSEEGRIWAFNFFFYNHQLKRVVFFFCYCVTKTADSYLSSSSASEDERGLDERLRSESTDRGIYGDSMEDI